MKKVNIIGSGIGGLACAIRLSNRGYKVNVFEKNNEVGGKLGEINGNGYRFDIGPSLLTMPELINELFQLENTKNILDFKYTKMEESCRYFYEDETMIIAHSNINKFALEAAEKTNIDPKKIIKYLERSQFLFNSTKSIFLEKSLHKFSSYLNFNSLKSILRIPFLGIFSSMSEKNNKTFKNEKIEKIFNRFATYNGSNPYKAPSILNLISHLEFNDGVYFACGGMRQIIVDLEKLCLKLGVKFHLNSTVSKILTNKKNVIGIETNQKRFLSDIVISNSDIYFTYKKLLNNDKLAKKELKTERSSSAIIFYWGIKHKFDELNLHNIFFSKNYKTEFQTIHEGTGVPEDPTIYINISSKFNNKDAPEDCENWFVMINVANNTGQNWNKLIIELRKKVINKLNNYFKQNIEELIEFEKVLDPRSIEKNTGAFQGSLYGSSSNNKVSAFFRHPNFSNNIKGLYFCGGTVHPGGGIPLALSSAKIIDKLIK